MTLLAINGFDAGHAGEWSGGAISTSGRNGGRCMDTLTSDVARSVEVGAGESLIVGFAFLRTDVSQTNDVLSIKQSGATNYFRMIQNTGGSLEFGLDSSPTGPISYGSFATTSFAMVADTWYYFEIEWLSHATTGIAKVRVDGAAPAGWTDITSGDTEGFSGGGDTYTLLFEDTTFGSSRIDDFYCADTAGSAPFNDFLGSVVVPYSPVDSQTSADFVGSDSNSVDNHLLLDEIPVSQTDYVESATTTDRDVYGVTALGLTGTPLAVQPIVLAEDSDAGTQPLEIGVISTTAAEESSTINLGSENIYRGPLVLDDPDGGGALTTTIVDAMELFIEVG